MNLETLFPLLEAIVADFTSYEAGTAVTAPVFTLDLSVIGLGKMAITISAKKAA